MRRAGPGFFDTATLTLAKKLLGTYLVRKLDGRLLIGRIVETEAYRGRDDPGSHAFHKKTPRNAVMFGPAGHAYIYFCYGNHNMFNIVTEKEGEAGAVLIRALEPVGGIAAMMKLRGTRDPQNLTNGPGKLCAALDIDKNLNTHGLIDSDRLYIALPYKNEKFTISCGHRIGIKQGLDKKWRFWIKGSGFVSRS
ncbi:MAG: DNA-3-methyladenine glycosylase [Spirochaetia bacterium]|nr:DNA-3-methyladenine glycosylase [Spirochaetia bacterium]